VVKLATGVINGRPLLLAGCGDGKVWQLDPETGQPLRCTNLGAPVIDLTTTEDRLFVCDQAGKVTALSLP